MGQDQVSGEIGGTRVHNFENGGEIKRLSECVYNWYILNLFRSKGNKHLLIKSKLSTYK